MLLRLRRLLPIAIGSAWLFASWKYLLGAPSFFELIGTALAGTALGDLSGSDMAYWIGSMMLAMALVDRTYVAIVRHFRGVDPLAVPWWRLRNEAGQPFCARCGSVFFMPPADLALHGDVRCGDCGHVVTSLADFRKGGPATR